jgi:hypothetical protein
MNQINKHFEAISSNPHDSQAFQDATIAVRSIRQEHRDGNHLDRLKEFSHEEIDLAFNPSQITEEEFDGLPYEEQLKIYRILTIYYEIPTPSKIDPFTLKEKYHTYKSAYRIDRIDAEDFLQTLQSAEEDDDYETVTELEKLIGIQKSEFFYRNIEATQKMIGFEYERFLDECIKRSSSEEQVDKCHKFFYKKFNEVLTFMIKDFENLNKNLQTYYHQSYRDAMPIEYVVSVTGNIDLFDEGLFELNPIEFSKILQSLEDIRKMDETRSQFPNWYAYYQNKLRDSKMVE